MNKKTPYIPIKIYDEVKYKIPLDDLGRALAFMPRNRDTYLVVKTIFYYYQKATNDIEEIKNIFHQINERLDASHQELFTETAVQYIIWRLGEKKDIELDTTLFEFIKECILKIKNEGQLTHLGMMCKKYGLRKLFQIVQNMLSARS